MVHTRLWYRPGPWTFAHGARVCVIDVLEGTRVKLQGFMRSIFFFSFCLLRKAAPSVFFFKILVAMVYFFVEVKPGCRISSKITTYVPSKGILVTLEMPTGILPTTSAPH